MGSYDDDAYFYEQDAAREQFIEDTLKGISQEAARSYLGMYGDAIDARVRSCLEESEKLMKEGHFGSSLCLSTTAIELMIRFMVLRPLIQGAFLSDEWAGILSNRIATGHTSEDRKLLPVVLKAWRIDLAALRTSQGNSVWELLTGKIWPHRNNFVHRAGPVSLELANEGLDCAACFRKQVVDVIATTLQFTLEETAKWSEIRTQTSIGSYAISYEPKDPFADVPQSS